MKYHDASHMAQSPFEMARSLALTTAARVDQRAIREQLAKTLVEQDRIGVQVKTNDHRIARVMLTPVASRPNKRQRIDRLVKLLSNHADDIYANRDNPARMRAVAVHIMRAVDHREATGRRNVTVQIVGADGPANAEVKAEPVDRSSGCG